MKVYATIDNPRMELADVPAHAKRAEKIGFDGLLVPEAVHDPFLMSALALEHTSKLKVATSVMPPANRRTMVLCGMMSVPANWEMMNSVAAR